MGVSTRGYSLLLECGGTHPEGTHCDTCHLVSTLPPPPDGTVNIKAIKVYVYNT